MYLADDLELLFHNILRDNCTSPKSGTFMFSSRYQSDDLLKMLYACYPVIIDDDDDDDDEEVATSPWKKLKDEKLHDAKVLMKVIIRFYITLSDFSFDFFPTFSCILVLVVIM